MLRQLFQKWGRSLLCIFLVAGILLVYVGRLVEWQFVKGDQFAKISENSSSFFVKLQGARGEILDKDGKTLAANRTTYQLVMNALTMEKNRNPAILKALALLAAHEVPWVDRLPIVISQSGAYAFVAEQESEIAFLKSRDMLNMQEYATADECMAALVERYDCESYTREEARNLISVRYYMTKTQFSMSSPYVIAGDVPITFAQVVSEHSGDLPGVELRVSTARDYGDGTTAPHVIGTLGSISQEQYDAFSAAGQAYSSDNVSGYTYTETVGRSGIESVFEEVLRGENGKEVISLGSSGEVTKTEVTELPQGGDSVYLTLDADLQRVANESLARNVAEAGKTTDCTAGAAVVLDIETFGVLASATYPNFDMTRYAKDDKYYNELIEDETKPLFNRALDGAFTPGSVLKPAVGLAALEEGVITNNDTVFCNGEYDFYKEYPLDCLGVHGYADIRKALGESCNTFFCDVGRRLGIERMEVYCNLLSLGERTGVEISESAGSMSNPTDYLYNHGVEWIDGVTIQAAIGQADSMFTPIQLATYCATIANDGKRYETHFLDKIMDYDGKKVVEQYTPQLVEEIGFRKANLQIIQDGMRAVTEEGGTGNAVFGNYGIAIGSKTGTAQNPGKTDSSVFMAYAPFDKPEIAVAVVLEYGIHGSLSQGIAKDIFDCYFYGKTLEKKAEEAAAAKATEEDGAGDNNQGDTSEE